MIHGLTDTLAFPKAFDAAETSVVAVGGDLCVERLLLAYESGIFPWVLDGKTIEWHCPDPRFVLFPDKLKISDSLARIIKSGRFSVTFDQDFPAVIEGCRTARRPWGSIPWLTDEMMRAYREFHKAGYVHSVEVWQDDKLVGGLYGVAVGGCFCGESMFHRAPNASKVGFVAQVQRLKNAGCVMIDCQVPTRHLASFGAECIPREEFLRLLREVR